MPGNQRLLIDIGQGLSIMVGMPTLTTWKTTDRPQKAKAGTFGFNSKTSSIEYWDGKQWFAASLSEKIG